MGRGSNEIWKAKNRAQSNAFSSILRSCFPLLPTFCTFLEALSPGGFAALFLLSVYPFGSFIQQIRVLWTAIVSIFLSRSEYGTSSLNFRLTGYELRHWSSDRSISPRAKTGKRSCTGFRIGRRDEYMNHTYGAVNPQMGLFGDSANNLRIHSQTDQVFEPHGNVRFGCNGIKAS